MDNLTEEQKVDFFRAVNEAVDIMFEIDALNAKKKELADHCKDVHGIPTKKFNRAVKISHDESLEEETEFFNKVAEIVRQSKEA